MITFGMQSAQDYIYITYIVAKAKFSLLKLLIYEPILLYIFMP